MNPLNMNPTAIKRRCLLPRLISGLLPCLLLGAISVLAAPYLLSAQDLPELNDSANRTLNPQDELILGKKLMADARTRLNLIDDLILESYVQALAERLVLPLSEQISGQRALPDLQISIALNPIINAFAVPGGQIAINSGLLTAAQSEGEFASVIAHEISHHSQRHIPRMLENAKQTTLPSTAALIGGLLIGGQAGVATVATVRAAVIADQLAYSRSYEQEADAAGMKLLAKAGYAPQNMPKFFSRLEKQSQIQGGEGPEFLRTHPLSGNRIAAAQARIKSLSFSLDQREPLNTLLDFPLAQMRATALYGEPLAQITATLRNDLQQAEALAAGDSQLAGDKRFVYAYGLSLAYMRGGDTQNAEAILNAVPAEAVSADGGYQAVLLLARAEIALKADKKTAALGLLNKLNAKHPKNLPIGLTRARVLKRLGHLDEAFQQTRRLMRDYPEQAQANLLLADIAGARDDLPQAAFHKAQFYFNLGHYKKAAQALAPYQAHYSGVISSYLASRIKDLQQQIDQAYARAKALRL